MKLLVIRFSSIGDIVLTTPVVRCIKMQRPDITVHYLTKASMATILEANPYIDKIHALQDRLTDIIPVLQEERYDFVVDLHHNFRSYQIKRALKLPSASFPKLNVLKWMYVNLKINFMPEESIVSRYMETVKSLGVTNDGRGLDYFIPPHVQVLDRDIPMSHWAGYVACVIGGSYATKQLPAEQWQAFIRQIPYPVILLGGPEDQVLGEEIASIDPIKIYNSCGKFSLHESSWLVQKAKVVVSNDTGLMHIASAYKKNLITIWGNTTPAMGMFPYYGNNSLKDSKGAPIHFLENNNLWCRPCSKLGYRKCPRGHFKCMKDLNMSELANLVKKNWG
jgi:ADP-heptose:LPS heptosyltransferase